jgi:hypothetical protein
MRSHTARSKFAVSTATRFALVVLVLAVGVTCLSMKQPPSQGAALLGLRVLEGGTSKTTFDINAVKPDASKGKISGQVRNKTNEIMTDLNITITPSPAGTKAPGISGGSVGSASIPTGGGTTVDVHLGNGVAIGATVDITIDLAAPAGVPPGTECTDFDLKLTPSGKRPSIGVEADLLAPYAFTTSRTILGNGAETHGNAAVAFAVRNDDAGIEKIKALSGLVDFREANSITAVDVYDSLSGSEVSGVTASFQGNSFTIAGLSIPSGQSKTILVRYANRPTGATSTTIQATFRP